MYVDTPDLYGEMPASPWGGLRYGAQPGSMAPPPEAPPVAAPLPMTAPQAAVPQSDEYPTFPNAAKIGSQKGYERSPPAPQPGSGATAPLLPTAGAAKAPINPWAALTQGGGNAAF